MNETLLIVLLAVAAVVGWLAFIALARIWTETVRGWAEVHKLHQEREESRKHQVKMLQNKLQFMEALAGSMAAEIVQLKGGNVKPDAGDWWKEQ